MENEIKVLREILIAVVNDLEQTSAELSLLGSRVHALAPISPAGHLDGLQVATKKNAAFYAGLRGKIETL